MADNIGMLLIHGVGLIGGSLGLAVMRSGLADEVVGVGRERDAEQLDLAVKLGAIHRYELSGQDNTGLYDACAEADLIALCTPVAAIARDLPGVLASVGADAVITDVGSVKSPILAAANHDPRFVGSHPMAGSERAGVEAARADLFEGATWAIACSEHTRPQAVTRVETLARTIGAAPRRMEAGRHDEAVALTSHLPHIIAYTLMALAGAQSKSNPDIPYLAAGSFAGATRVAASLPAMWSEIAAQNRIALSDVLRDYRARLDAVQALLDSGGGEADEGLNALFEAGCDARREWKKS